MTKARVPSLWARREAGGPGWPVGCHRGARKSCPAELARGEEERMTLNWPMIYSLVVTNGVLQSLRDRRWHALKSLSKHIPEELAGGRADKKALLMRGVIRLGCEVGILETRFSRGEDQVRLVARRR